MDFQALKALLKTRLVALERDAAGRVVPVRPPGMRDDWWDATVKELAPALVAHSWAVDNVLLGTWPLPRLLAWMDEHEIRVTMRGGRPYLTLPETMGDAARQYHTRVLLPQLKASRAAVLEFFNPPIDSEIQELMGKVVYPPGPAADERRVIVDTLTRHARLIGGRVGWFSRYTMATGYVPADNPRLPHFATQALVESPAPADRPGVQWTPLPGHAPPKGWTWPSGKPLPEPCLPPPGYREETAATLREKRSRWYKDNWGDTGKYPVRSREED